MKNYLEVIISETKFHISNSAPTQPCSVHFSIFSLFLSRYLVIFVIFAALFNCRLKSEQRFNWLGSKLWYFTFTYSWLSRKEGNSVINGAQNYAELRPWFRSDDIVTKSSGMIFYSKLFVVFVLCSSVFDFFLILNFANFL